MLMLRAPRLFSLMLRFAACHAAADADAAMSLPRSRHFRASLSPRRAADKARRADADAAIADDFRR